MQIMWRIYIIYFCMFESRYLLVMCRKSYSTKRLELDLTNKSLNWVIAEDFFLRVPQKPTDRRTHTHTHPFDCRLAFKQPATSSHNAIQYNWNRPSSPDAYHVLLTCILNWTLALFLWKEQRKGSVWMPVGFTSGDVIAIGWISLLSMFSEWGLVLKLASIVEIDCSIGHFHWKIFTCQENHG